MNLKGNQSWLIIVRTDAEAEISILWPSHVKNWIIWKDPDPGKDWRQEEKGTTEDEMVGWHHWLNGLESEQTLGDGEWQGSPVCCSSRGWKESDMIEQLKNNKKKKSLREVDMWEKSCFVYKWGNSCRATSWSVSGILLTLLYHAHCNMPGPAWRHTWADIDTPSPPGVVRVCGSHVLSIHFHIIQVSLMPH